MEYINNLETIIPEQFIFKLPTKNKNSKIPVVLEPIGMQAVVSGTGGDNGKIQYTKGEYVNDIKNQEIIAYTSGLGGLFKPGMPVGKIYKNNPYEIEFFSDFKQLEYVKIISHSIEDNN